MGLACAVWNPVLKKLLGRQDAKKRNSRRTLAAGAILELV
jgi:hypothetical protein